MRQRGCFHSLLLAGAFAAALGVPTLAGADASVPNGLRSAPFSGQAIDAYASFSALAVINETELGAMRGGFTLGGLDVEFGANMRTFIDGTLALESVVALTESGPVVQQVTPTGGAAVPNTAGMSLIFADGSSATLKDATPSNVDLTALAGAHGIVLNDRKGFTTVLHRVNKDQILSVLINTASGRAIRNDLELTVTLTNFTQSQQAARSALLNGRLAGATNRSNRSR